MVSSQRRGASTVGCLLWLLFVVAAVYYGVNIGEVYVRYYRLQEELDSQARLASAIDNGTIGRRIAAAVDDIGVPDSASNVTITRSTDPRQINIETAYSERVTLPFFDHTFTFHLKATEPL